jgi:TM2 domain-containing membrane protein YozV
VKNTITAAILAFFLGGIVVHRFYLGEGGLGLFYLIFCWTFFLFIIAFVDFFIFLTMDENKFNTNYNLDTVLNSTRGFNTAEELGKLHDLMEKGIITA